MQGDFPQETVFFVKTFSREASGLSRPAVARSSLAGSAGERRNVHREGGTRSNT